MYTELQAAVYYWLFRGLIDGKTAKQSVMDLDLNFDVYYHIYGTKIFFLAT